MYTPIPVTASNLHEAIRKNLIAIYEEMSHKLPLKGTSVLKGDLNFNDNFTVRGVLPNGPRSAICLAPKITEL